MKYDQRLWKEKISVLQQEKEKFQKELMDMKKKYEDLEVQHKRMMGYKIEGLEQDELWDILENQKEATQRVEAQLRKVCT